MQSPMLAPCLRCSGGHPLWIGLSRRNAINARAEAAEGLFRARNCLKTTNLSLEVQHVSRRVCRIDWPSPSYTTHDSRQTRLAAGWSLLLRCYELQVQTNQPKLARRKRIGATKRTPTAPICVSGEAAHRRPLDESLPSLTFKTARIHAIIIIASQFNQRRQKWREATKRVHEPCS